MIFLLFSVQCLRYDRQISKNLNLKTQKNFYFCCHSRNFVSFKTILKWEIIFLQGILADITFQRNSRLHILAINILMHGRGLSLLSQKNSDPNRDGVGWGPTLGHQT